jgi:hypothetical protein
MAVLPTDGSFRCAFNSSHIVPHVYSRQPWGLGMKRSAGIVMTAVIVLLGSAFTLLCGAMMVLVFWIAPPPAQEMPLHFMKYFMLLIAAIMFGMGSWGVATGVGLLKLKGWARISLLVFSGLLLVFSLPSMLMFSFIPMQPVPNANVPESFYTGLRAGMVVFYGLQAALGGWWLYYFTRRGVKAQFGAGGALPEAVAAAPKRPISITVIACYLIFTSCFLPMVFFIHVPAIFIGYVLTGWAATLLAVAYGVLNIVMGVGLLKLKEWSRILAICYFCFAFCNALASFLPTGSRARFGQVMDSMRTSMGLPSGAMASFPIWLGLVFSLPVICVVLWFLIKEKKAFQESTEAPAPIS